MRINSRIQIVLILGLFLSFVFGYLSLRDKGLKNKSEFYKSKISSIIKSSKSFYGRSIEFQLENRSSIFLPSNSQKMFIKGDSVFKNNNTYLYNVYRKNENGNYSFFGTFNY